MPWIWCIIFWHSYFQRPWLWIGGEIWNQYFCSLLIDTVKWYFHGNRVTLGKPEPTIKWYKDGKDLADGPDFEISYREGRVSLMIPETFQEDAGKYLCKATNPGGAASSSSELIVRGKAEVLTRIYKVVGHRFLESLHIIVKQRFLDCWRYYI